MHAGAAAMDNLFEALPLAENPVVIASLIGWWNRTCLQFKSRAVIPYAKRLRLLPQFLQQLEMESNGKRVGVDGSVLPFDVGPIEFGEPGTNGQHAFFQMLHQGTDVIPVDFLVAAQPTHADPHHHALLVANCFAQSEALMRGRSLAEAEAGLLAQGMDAAAAAALAPHKRFPGDRPSSTFLYRALTPRQLGRLIALYEHKVFVQSVIWDINPFDQWGVELGKELCNRLAPIVEDRNASVEGLDGSTAGLIGWRRALTG
jgi:glucose-6-phosphate isomerase